MFLPPPVNLLEHRLPDEVPDPVVVVVRIDDPIHILVAPRLEPDLTETRTRRRDAEWLQVRLHLGKDPYPCRDNIH